MNKKILLVDANLLMFRSFYAAYAINKNPSNMPMHLFFSSLFESIKVEQPSYLFLAFDAYGKTKRHDEYPEYKAGRQKAPDALYEQKEKILKVLDQMNIFYFSQIGDEADDLIATLTNKFKNEYEIVILSEDKDLLQLVDNNVCVKQKNRDKKLNQKYIKINNENFYDIFSFYPNQVVDYKGIAGDNSDNLIGIKGVGPKTTIELLSKYQTLENIYSNLNELSSKQQETFLKFKDQALLCKKLATLNENVDMDIELNQLLINENNFYNQQVFDLLENFGLNKILNMLKNLKK